jgi:hypothetical protein
MFIWASAAALAGCGGGGVSSEATVSAYVAAPLCAGAKQELARSGGQAGSVHVRAVCLPDATKEGKLSLASIGANARRATEDSTSVAYLESPNQVAARFSHPILESAGVPWIPTSKGSAAMARLLGAIKDAGSGSRGSVRDALHKS